MKPWTITTYIYVHIMIHNNHTHETTNHNSLLTLHGLIIFTIYLPYIIYIYMITYTCQGLILTTKDMR